MLSYYMREAREGLLRNAGAGLAAAALIAVAMTLLGAMLLFRSGLSDLRGFLESQVSMKVYVSPGVDPREAARILEARSFVKSVQVETKEEMLQKLAAFFEGKEQLLDSFKQSGLPDAIRLELRDPAQAEAVAGQLRGMSGIMEVIYPQRYAETVLQLTRQLSRYGTAAFVFFAAVSFLTVFLAMHLSLYQRQKEIRVKLLLGANPAHVRGQFLFEGGIIGLLGSLAAAAALDMLYRSMLFPLERQFRAVFHLTGTGLYGVELAVAAAGTVIGVAASFASTRKLMKDG